ncbi:MAG: NAD(P)/FAD-dependent oxidoreductase [Oscillospiraceae bacterium]|nr:NAD(P)/FAD-dependent oxidoreductase [Oscillospiraceae bacterium]
MYDVLIIGGGVAGCAIAREISRYDARVCVLERCHDIAMGTTKANSAVVHAGYDAVPGTLKAQLNIAGNRMFAALSRELDFPFKQIGSLVLCFDENAVPELEKLRERGKINGVSGLEVIGRGRLEEMEPNIGDSAVAALWAPTGGIVCPYEMTYALAENAAVNGVEFHTGREVISAARDGDGFAVETPEKTYRTKIIVNAAGVFANEIHNMLSENKLHIIPRSGQYILLDKAVGGLVSHTIFQLPGEMGKGILVTPTVDGNLLLGPTAVNTNDKSDIATRREYYDEIIEAASLSVKSLPYRQMITAFTGLRAHCTAGDFVIAFAEDAPGLLDVAGIESPGLTAAPAIGQKAAGMLRERFGFREKADFSPVRKAAPKFREMSMKERQNAIAADPAYGKIVCRCEAVSEAEIIAAIHSPVGAKDLDGIKRRTRAGMGRCQGGFCSPQAAEILSRELNIPLTAVTKSGPGSEILACRIRG